MGKEKDGQSEDAPEEPQQRAPQGASDEDFDKRFDAALERLVSSGRLVGGDDSADGDSRAGRDSPGSSSPSFDLDAAVEAALSKRQASQDAENERKERAHDRERIGALEKRGRGWFNPWRP